MRLRGTGDAWGLGRHQVSRRVRREGVGLGCLGLRWTMRLVLGSNLRVLLWIGLVRDERLLWLSLLFQKMD
jgi:hypothetical protein